ncbi:MAG: RNA-binding protein [Desulfofustis sp.]|nr:Jag N-terminal domain-containing protein [Desulfofustis sp.]NNK13880.1 RNA-binding protein [Desulfofustis sp.]
MSSETKDFYGKNVAVAIKKACEEFGVAQENLTIEVLETGSKGIFGLIRQKAHIRVKIQAIEEEAVEPSPEKQAAPAKQNGKKKPARSSREKQAKEPKAEPEKVPQPEPVVDPSPGDDELNDNGDTAKPVAELSEDTMAIVRDELTSILALMECPSTVTVQAEEGTAHCKVSDEHQEVLTSQDGRVLDSLQYLLRKIVSKKITGRIQLTIDVGDFREKRFQELKERAIEYAALVKEDGKTQVISSLNPSERRVVHVALQDDPDIRSRSVGEGLFKKVLIYKPGKGRKNNNRKRGRPRSRKKNDSGSVRES